MQNNQLNRNKFFVESVDLVRGRLMKPLLNFFLLSLMYVINFNPNRFSIPFVFLLDGSFFF